MNNDKQLKHLWARAGFGMRFEDLKKFKNETVKRAVKHLFKEDDNGTPIDVVKTDIDYSAIMKSDMLARKMFLQQQRQQEKDLNLAWMERMSTTDAPLRENMTLFWHNHFA